MKTLSQETKNLLSKEAALSSMNLGVGLTFIRKYDFTSLGFIYQSFFSLSVGIERLLKLILLYEYIYVNDCYPDFKYLKSKGHKLTDLFNEVKKISIKYSSENQFILLDEDPIFNLILTNLSDFATENRYFNLNQLSGNHNTQDPVGRWDKEINSMILSRHFKENTPKNKTLKDIAIMMEQFTIVRHHDENDNEINSYSEFMNSSSQIGVKQKYSMYYTYCIIHAICELQWNQNLSSYTDIRIDEYFMVFRAAKNYAKNKKTWNPHPPYRF